MTQCSQIVIWKQKQLFTIKSGGVEVNGCCSQKQMGTIDCGLFATANATAIAHGKNPSKLQ